MRIHPLFLATAVGVGSFGLGVVVGYKVAYRNLEIAFEERMLKETEGMRQFYQQTTVSKKPFSTPEEAAAALIQPGTVLKETAVSLTPEGIAERVAYHKITKNYTDDAGDLHIESDGIPEISFPEPPEPEQHNVFADGPAIISQEEFLENDSDFMQSTLTYYAVDNVLTDEREQVIEDPGDVVGLTNLQKFGELSSDENTVHIRNIRLGLEFELVRHEGSYRQEILGIDENPPQRPSGRDR